MRNLSTKLAIALTVILPMVPLIVFIKFYNPPLPPVEDVVSRIIESGNEEVPIPDKATEIVADQTTRLAELAFEAGALAMALAIREDQAVLNQGPHDQYEAARAWWIKNNADPSPLTTPRPRTR